MKIVNKTIQSDRNSQRKREKPVHAGWFALQIFICFLRQIALVWLNLYNSLILHTLT